MRLKKRHYLQILKIELEDLKEDLDLLINESTERYKQEQITDHVFLANLTLFKNELLGVNEFFLIVDQTDPEACSTLDELIEGLRRKFQEKVEKHGIANAVNICIERKLMKVARYVTQ